MLNLRGWLGGLGGAAAVTIGVVVAALIAAGLTATHGGDGHVRMRTRPQQLALGDERGLDTAVTATSPDRRQSTRTSPAAPGGTRGRSRTLAGHSGPMSVRHDPARPPKPRLPGNGSHDTSSPAPRSPGGSSPGPGGGGGNPGGGGGGGQPSSLGNAVKNTTQQLGNAVNGATQTVGDTVGAVSPALGNSVKQTGPALGDTVKGTGDIVGNTVDGLLGGRR